MKSNILRSPENLTLNWIFTDPMAIMLLKTLHNRPKHQRQKETFAAAYVTEQGKILALGRNMQVLRSEKWPVLQGYANHAEMMAYSAATLINEAIAPGFIYVIGFLAGNKVFIHNKLPIPGKRLPMERFTCSLCAKKMCEHQINGVAIPNSSGWKKLRTAEIVKTAKVFNQTSGSKKSGRINESMLVSDEYTQKLLQFLMQKNPQEIIKLLEQNYEIDPFVIELIRLAKNGYIETKSYKSTVNKFKTVNL